MKARHFAAVAALGVALALGGCGSDAPEGSAPQTEQQAPEAQPAPDYSGLVGTNLYDAYQQVKADGYTATVVQDGTGIDQTSIFTDEYNDSKEDVEFIMGPWTVTAVSDIDPEAKTLTLTGKADATIASENQQSAEEAELEKRLDYGHAVVALEDYGKQQYLYGFELHQFFGVILKEGRADGWHLKMTCDVTNMYGAEAEMTCEAVVDGTNEAPQVTSFLVY